jgi:hypothetical protein
VAKVAWRAVEQRTQSLGCGGIEGSMHGVRAGGAFTQRRDALRVEGADGVTHRLVAAPQRAGDD